MPRERITRIRKTNARNGAEDAFKQTQGKQKSLLATSGNAKELDTNRRSARIRNKRSQTEGQTMAEAEKLAPNSGKEFAARHLSVKGYQTRGAPSFLPNTITPQIQHHENQLNNSSTRDFQRTADNTSDKGLEHHCCRNCNKCATDETDEEEQEAPDDNNDSDSSSSSSSSSYHPTK